MNASSVRERRAVAIAKLATAVQRHVRFDHVAASYLLPSYLPSRSHERFIVALKTRRKR